MARGRTASSGYDLSERVQAQYEQALRAEEAAGRSLATGAILSGLGVVAVWLLVQVGRPSVWYYETFVALFAGLTLANYLLARSRYDWLWRPYVFVALCIVIMTFAIVVPNPFIDSGWPDQTSLRLGNFGYILLFLAPVALSYRPSLVVWAGAWAALAWAIGVGWILTQPGTLTWQSLPPAAAPRGPEETLAFFLNPHFVDYGAHIQDMLVALLLAGVLALVTWRSRRLVLRQIMVARERANLARYFPPRVVDELARLDQPLGPTRQQPVAVMFADIVGFTELAERCSPDHVVATLRAFHERVERAIFDCGGTLDKFLGDGVMATFGTPNVGPRDALQALLCALAMQESIAAWNVERAERGEATIRLSIGIHFGPVILGDIGSFRQLEFAVLGDVVNVAQRLERLTREFPCRMVISDDLVRAMHVQDDDQAGRLLAGFRADTPQHLRGRAEPVAVWTLA